MESSLVQAEPFYPHYIPAGTGAVAVGDGVQVAGGDHLGDASTEIDHTGGRAAPWNRPLDGAVGGSQSWMEPKDKGVATSYKVSSQLGGPAPEALVVLEHKMGGHGKHTQPVARKVLLDSECLEWLENRPPTIVEENVQAPFKMSGTSVSAPTAFAERTSCPYPVAFTEAGNMLNSNSSYDKYISQLGSCRNDPMIYHSATTYSSPAQVFVPSSCRTNISTDKSMPKNISSCVQYGDGSKNNEKYKGSVSVKLKGPIISVNNEGKKAYPEKNGMNGKKGDNSFANSSAVKITFPSSHESATANSQSHSLGITSELKITNLKLPTAPCAIAPGSAESCDSKQSSSEILDQLNIAVDSPCWKGTSFSQRSPFSAVETVVISSSATDQKSGNADKTGSDCVKLENVKGAQCLGGPEEERNEVNSMKDTGISFRSKDYDVVLSCQEENSGASATEPVLVAGIANPEIDAKIPAQDCSSRLWSASKEQASVAVAGVSNEIAVTSDTSGKYPPVGMDIPLLAKTTHNLSELLLSSCYGNENALRENDLEVLRSTIDNLHMCVFKMGGSDRMKPELAPHLCSSYPYRNVSSYEGTLKGKLQLAGLEADGVQNQNNNISSYFGPAKMHSISSNMISDKVNNFVSTSGDINLGKSNGMTQLLEKFMKENIFEKGEDPQTILYKQLWIEAEVTLYSLKYELQLSRLKHAMKHCKQQLTEEFHSSVDAGGSPSNVLQSSTLSSTNDIDGEHLSVLKAGGGSLFKNISALENESPPKKADNWSSSMKYQEMILSGTKKAVMARLKVSEDQIDRVNCVCVEELQRLTEVDDVTVTEGGHETFCVPYHSDCDLDAAAKRLQKVLLDPTSVARRNP